MAPADISSFSALEMNILKTKGLDNEQVKYLEEQGICCKADFETVGDAATLAAVAGISVEVGDAVMSWATGKTAVAAPTGRAVPADLHNIVVQSHDAVYCAHCEEKQPKDYKVGDLCIKCGKQAEPVNTCHWCHSQGPGKFCRGCGAEFAPVAELDLALLLKREGIAKDEISAKLKLMDDSDKQRLWDRVRKT